MNENRVMRRAGPLSRTRCGGPALHRGCGSRAASSQWPGAEETGSRVCGAGWLAAPPPGRKQCSLKRRGEQEPAFGPQFVLAARKLERRAAADGALVGLAVVSDLLDYVVHPV